MYDLVVIGAGSGGLYVAAAAARVGASVALIEKRRLVGEGAVAAYLPSKGLVQAARLVQRIRTADAFGIHTAAPRVDFAAVMSRVRDVSSTIAGHGTEESLKARGIDVYHGSASFEAYDTVLLEDGTRVVGQRFVIATGSRPAIPDVAGLVEAGYLDSTTLWSLTSVPESLVILGAGPVGLEFAQVFARFGSRVTVLADSDRVLPAEEPEVSEHVVAMLAAEGITVRTGVTLTKVENRGGQKVCVVRDLASGATSEEAASEILVAAGRLANVEGLNLEAVGVHADPKHGIEVDELLQTHAARIFAIGDVLLRHQSVHAAEREAEEAFQNTVLRRRKKFDDKTLPRATFLDPEVASVGLSEEQARAEQRDCRVFRVSYAEIERACIDGRPQGFAKVVATPAGKILGAAIVGEGASLILQELVLAMDAGLGLSDIAASTHIYPTYSDVVLRLARQYQSTRLETGFMQTVLKLYYGFRPRGGALPATNGGAESESHSVAEPAATSHGHGH